MVVLIMSECVIQIRYTSVPNGAEQARMRVAVLKVGCPGGVMPLGG